MENLNPEKEVREALDKLDRKRKSIILRSFLRLLIPIGVVAFIVWYSSTVIEENYVIKIASTTITEENRALKAANAEQAQTIKHITDNFFKVTGGQNEEITFLREQNAALRKQLEELRR